MFGNDRDEFSTEITKLKKKRRVTHNRKIATLRMKAILAVSLNRFFLYQKLWVGAFFCLFEFFV